MNAYTLAAAPFVLLGIAEPALFLLYGLLAALVLIACLLAGGYELKRKLADAEVVIGRLEAENNNAAAENARLEALTTPVPLLSIVPPQRDGGHDDFPVADIDVPVHTDIADDDWLELLITRPVDGPTS